MTAPTEKTVRYATTVDEMPAAWEFVMAHIEDVGPAPSVVVKAFLSSEDEQRYAVSVSGMTEERS